jgi:hypothetical protein
MIRRLSPCAPLLAALAVLPLPARAWTAEEVIAEAQMLCAGFDNGTVSVAPEAVVQLDLTGDALPETLVDWSGLGCSTMASAWGGTGGTMLSVLIEGQRFDHLALAWQVVDFDGPVLLLRQHGVNCNGSGADRCVQALLWTAGTLTGAGWGTGEDEGPAMPAGE